MVKKTKSVFEFISLPSPTFFGFHRDTDGVVAQLVERIVRSDEVVGSIPINSTRGRHSSGAFFWGLWIFLGCFFRRLRSGCVGTEYRDLLLYSFNSIQRY